MWIWWTTTSKGGYVTPMYNPPHPGEVVLEFCLDGMDPGLAAERLGMPRDELDRLLEGKRSLSLAIAQKLEEAGWSNADFWVRLQRSYDRAQEPLRQAAAA